MSINRLLLACLPLAVALLGQGVLAVDDAEALAGKWSVNKTNDQGQTYTQTITVNKDKFVLQILGTDSQVFLHAQGDLKLEKIGPFTAARFVKVSAGRSATDLQDVDDEYACPYLLEGETWTIASNLDKQRELQRPSLDVYHRVKAAVESRTLVIDEIEMADTPQGGTWFVYFEITVGGVTRSYHVAGKGYDKNQVTIPVALELPKVQAGQKCSFKLQLDDVDEDVSTSEVDNRSLGEFTVSERGTQGYKPEDNWRYTIRWHLK